jgi:hypothetical protein
LVADGGSHFVGIHAAQVLPLLGFVPVQRAPRSATSVFGRRTEPVEAAGEGITGHDASSSR